MMSFLRSFNQARRLAWLAYLPPVAAGLSLLAGTSALLGWLLNVSILNFAWLGQAPVGALEGLGLLLSGVALWLSLGPESAWRRRTALLMALAAASLGLAGLIFPPAVSLPFPSALALALTGTALAFLVIEGSTPSRLADLTLLAALTFAALVAAGYLFGLEPLFRGGTGLPESFLAGFMFCLLAAGALTARPERGAVQLMTSDHSGGVLIRRLIPLATISVFVLGKLELVLQQQTGSRADVLSAWFSLFVMIVIVVLAWIGAVYFENGDKERQHDRDQLQYQANLLSEISDAVISTDLDSRIASWNHGAEQLYGWSAAEALGRLMGDLVSTDYGGQTRDAAVAELRETGRWRGEITQRRRDGQALTIMSSVVLLSDGAGRPGGMVAVNRDITALKLAQDVLARQTARLNNLHEIDRDILKAGSLVEIANSALLRLRPLIPDRRLSITVIDADGAAVEFVVDAGDDVMQAQYGREASLDEAAQARLSAGEVLQWPDLAALPQPQAPRLTELAAAGMRSYAAVPLIAGEELIGLLNVIGRTAGALDDYDVEVAAEVAAQLAIAIRQSRSAEEIQRYSIELEHKVEERTTSLQSALAVTAALYEIAQLVTAIERLPEILPIVVDIVSRALPANRVVFMTVDQASHQITRCVAGGPGADLVVTTISFEELWNGLGGWVLREMRPALSPKAPPDPRESPAVRQRRAATQAGSIVVAPLVYLEEVLGIVTAINLPDEPDFAESQVEFLTALANQAAVVIARARLMQQLQDSNAALHERGEQLQHELAERRRFQDVLRRQNDFLAALHQITLDLISRRDLEDLLQALVLHASQLLDAPYGEIMLIEGDELVVKAFTANQAFLAGDRLGRTAPSLSWRAFDTRLPSVVEDYSTWAGRRAVYDGAELRAVADFPIIVGDRCLGVLAVGRDRPGYTFDPEQVQYGDLFAQLSALALDNAQLRDNLRQQSIRDPLTGLFNRRYMEEVLAQNLYRAARQQRPLTILMLDFDYFKRFNDNYGHAAGDALLREVAQFMKHNFRGDDVVCRYGGEEFVLILPDAPLDKGLQRAEFLRSGVQDLTVQHDGRLLGGLSLSLGLAAYPEHGYSPATLLEAADSALYRAKKAGRNRAAVYEG